MPARLPSGAKLPRARPAHQPPCGTFTYLLGDGPIPDDLLIDSVAWPNPPYGLSKKGVNSHGQDHIYRPNAGAATHSLERQAAHLAAAALEAHLQASCIVQVWGKDVMKRGQDSTWACMNPG